MEHDLRLIRNDGSVRYFHFYNRQIPKDGEIIALPIDGQPIKASIKASPEGTETAILADAEAIEI